MSIRTMLTIVRGFGWIAVAAAVLAGTGAFAGELAGDEEGLSAGLQLHIGLGLAAGLLATAAHVFFVFFLPRATVGLSAAGLEFPGWGVTVLLSLLAVATTLAAVVLGVQSMTESFKDDLHRGVSLTAAALQIAALVSQTKASARIARAEAQDGSD